MIRLLFILAAALLTWAGCIWLITLIHDAARSIWPRADQFYLGVATYCFLCVIVPLAFSAMRWIALPLGDRRLICRLLGHASPSCSVAWTDYDRFRGTMHCRCSRCDALLSSRFIA